jgi:hypothetical protein
MKRSIEIGNGPDGLVFLKKSFSGFVVLHGSVEDPAPQDEEEQNGDRRGLENHN